MENLFELIYYYRLRNEAHVEAHVDVQALLKKIGPGTIGAKSISDEYDVALTSEIKLLDMIRKSEVTALIEEQDAARDSVYHGLVAAIASYHHHFDAAKREAARRLQIVIDNYGNVSRKTYSEESAAIDDILREFATEGHAALVALLGLGEWITRLATANAALVALVRERDEELSQRPAQRMKEAREIVDKLLHSLLKRVEAVVLINGIDFTPELSLFINEYNVIVRRYKQTLATEKGRREASSSKDEGDGNEENEEENEE
ncbi:MAG: DUF6261 family protein [Odoribacteraceae bacterium]|jgi:hypothetical protein|nr:DUF6261 family protein [Odoribacteraceae bacterium]